MPATYKSPLEGYESAEPLPTEFNADGKSLYNPPGPRSAAYDEFPRPIDPSNNGFDFHSKYQEHCIISCGMIVEATCILDHV